MSVLPPPRTGSGPTGPPVPPSAAPPCAAPRPAPRQQGFVTAETAVLLPFLLAVVVVLVWVVSLGLTQVRLVDAAREGARAVARGEPTERVRADVVREAPTGARVRVESDGSSTVVTVSSRRGPRLPLLGEVAAVEQRARAVTATEGGSGEAR